MVKKNPTHLSQKAAVQLLRYNNREIDLLLRPHHPSVTLMSATKIPSEESHLEQEMRLDPSNGRLYHKILWEDKPPEEDGFDENESATRVRLAIGANPEKLKYPASDK